MTWTKWDLVPFINGDGFDLDNTGEPLFPTLMRMPYSRLRLIADGALDFLVVRRAFQGSWSDYHRKLKHNGRLILTGALTPPPAWHMVYEQDDLRVFESVPRDAGLPKDRKTCAIVRTGGFGDALQVGSLLDPLKEEGYHITLYTEIQGEQIMRHDPRIDRIIHTRQAMLHFTQFHEFWQNEYPKYDRWINLSQSIESTLLLQHEQQQFYWPDAVLRSMCNINYQERIHAIAQVPTMGQQRFVPTKEEEAWASQWRVENRVYSPDLVVIATTGTLPNKWWPYVGELSDRLAKCGKHVVLLGEKIGDVPIHQRIHKIGLNWDIRRACTMAQHAWVVIGQETSILNAVANWSNRKVVLLTHSTEKNLTRHWTNTVALHGDVPCYPCHRIHPNWDYCPTDDRIEKYNAASCQAAISVDAVLEAMKERTQAAA